MSSAPRRWYVNEPEADAPERLVDHETKTLCDRFNFHPLKFMLAAIPKLPLKDQVEIAKTILPYYYKQKREEESSPRTPAKSMPRMSEDELLAVLQNTSGQPNSRPAA